MPVVTYIEANGREIRVEAASGATIMQTAVDNGVEGIVGECCGSMACATCHCYIDEAWLDRTGGFVAGEADILSGSPCELKANSRLGCQIVLSDALDGLVVYVPASQY